MPAAASVKFMVDDKVMDRFFLNFSNTEEAGYLMEERGVVLFEGLINYKDQYLEYIDTGRTFSYQVEAVDEAGNTATSDMISLSAEDLGLR